MVEQIATGHVAAAPFDTAAPDYDRVFSHHRIGRILRHMVHRLVDPLLLPDSRVLDFGCGTGEDALWLSRRGCTVTVADASPAMLETTRIKLDRQIPGRKATFLRLDGNDPDAVDAALGERRFDWILSNFGAVNAIDKAPELLACLGRHVRPGGHLALVVMNPVCAWEIFGELARGRPSRAFRRLRRQQTVRIGTGPAFKVSYPPPRHIVKAVGPSFATRKFRGIGVFLPPTEFFGWLDRHPRLAAVLTRAERKLAGIWPFHHLGDHVMIVFEKSAGGVES